MGTAWYVLIPRGPNTKVSQHHRPIDSPKQLGCNRSIAADSVGRQYLVVAHGTSAEAAKARNILSTLKSTHVTDHVLESAMQ
jgi:hypothetical protein